MSEFKLDCPNCKQRMQVPTQLVGHQIDCPSCKKRFTVAAPEPVPPPPQQPPGGAPETPKTQPDRPVPPKEALSSEPAPAATPPAAVHPADPASAPPPAASTPGPSRVAVLNPEVKLDIVRTVRRQLSDKSRWMPGMTAAGEKVYTANSSGSSVEPGNPDAARFSLVGAVLHEFALRDVARNAQGRRRMLDQEIPSAVKEVLFGDAEDAEEHAASVEQLLSISYEQCLEALDNLEERYRTRKVEAATEETAKKLGSVSIDDLLKRVEKKLQISADDVAIALFQEIQQVKLRLDKIERAMARRTTRDE